MSLKISPKASSSPALNWVDFMDQLDEQQIIKNLQKIENDFESEEKEENDTQIQTHTHTRVKPKRKRKSSCGIQ